jgi:hypothetical protein
MKWETPNRRRVRGRHYPIADEADEVRVGTREDLISRLERKYGYSKENAETWPVFLVTASRRMRTKGMAYRAVEKIRLDGAPFLKKGLFGD